MTSKLPSPVPCAVAALIVSLTWLGAFFVFLPAAVQADASCERHRAWPEGPHLSEKNETIVDLFFAVWGGEACTQWADEHRESAIKGLRELGYEVNRPVTPVLQVDELTFRGRGQARGEITLEPGCYIAWLDYADRTPEQRLADGWDAWSGSDRPWIYAKVSDPNEELYGYSGHIYDNEEGFAQSDGVAWVIGVTNDHIPSYGQFDFTPEIIMAPGTWRWRITMPRSAENEDWELRLIPTEYAVTPWDWWAQESEWTPPCLIQA